MIQYSKYSSCGNDFIVIDNRKNVFCINNVYIQELCNRKTGIGSDGLILLSSDSMYSYFMSYFNSDGYESSFCGNGSMCCGHFALSLGVFGDTNVGKGVFRTNEGVFNVSADLNGVNGFGVASISMIDVVNFEIIDDDLVMNTGSPHYVRFVSNLNSLDVEKIGRTIRYGKKFEKEGVNVTFVSYENHQVFIRTYERGVEGETLSCGTGAVAAALFMRIKKKILTDHVIINTSGGQLNVSFTYNESSFINITLESAYINRSFDGFL